MRFFRETDSPRAYDEAPQSAGWGSK